MLCPIYSFQSFLPFHCVHMGPGSRHTKFQATVTNPVQDSFSLQGISLEILDFWFFLRKYMKVRVKNRKIISKNIKSRRIYTPKDEEVK